MYSYNRLNKTKCLVLAVAVILSLTTACQPTPEREIVRNKQKSNMMEIINSHQKNTPYIVPERVERNIVSNNKDVTITVDSVIDISKAKKHSVYTIEPWNLSNEDAAVILHALIGDRQLWSTNWGIEVMTKDFLESILLKFKKQLAETTDEVLRADLERLITFNEERYEDAQDTRYEIPAMTTFSDVKGKQLLNELEYEWSEYGEVYGRKASEKEYNKERDKLLDEIENETNLSIEGIAGLGFGEEAYVEIFKDKNNKGNRVHFM